jgi:hypothetical protein
MKKILLAFVGLLIGAFLFGQECSDIFISEYVEGTANSKAIEIYNPTGNAIDLSNYQVKRYSNGSNTATSGGITTLEGTIQPYSTFILCNGQTDQIGQNPPCDPDLQALAQQLDHPYPAPTYFNGNDALTIENINGTIVDIFGKIGEDPGDGWCDIDTLNYACGTYWWLSWTSNHTLVRKASVKEGVKYNPGSLQSPDTYFMVQNEWDTVPGYWSAEDTMHVTANIWDNLGSHDCECDPNYSIGEIQNQNEIYFFPNPVSDNRLLIKGTEIIESVQIVNTIGQTVFSRTNEVQRGDMEIQFSRQFTGLHIAIVTFIDGTKSSKKFIIK